jgi:hypothetical protein
MIPDPGSGSASKNCLALKTFKKVLGKMIWDVHPGSGFFSIPIQGVEKAPDPGCGTLPGRLK